MRRARRRLGTVLIVLGLLVIGYAAAALFRRDPPTVSTLVTNSTI
jgi:hypothetical protein